MVWATLAGGLGVGTWLWSYNRENFKFDREMRQKNELKILEFRNVQSSLWREDIRDIISLTEKKMDSYLIISVLQLDACVALFTEGRLEPGTPPWLLHLYMMTLGGAFMYLLMSVWFAMHASVVAQCSSVRLLTQFVRLPIPTWEDIEQMRTYASSYEKMHPAHWLRVPFTTSLAPGAGLVPPQEGAPGTRKAAEATPAGGLSAMDSTLSAGSSTDSAADAGGAKPKHADPWGLETHGHHREIYELTEEHPALRRHVLLARKAASQYQCYDAFARVAMTFGTNQFLSAIAYYAMGYVAVQDGAPWVSVGVTTTMGCMASAMVGIDFSLTRCEQRSLQLLIAVALGAALWATFAATMSEGPQAKAESKGSIVVKFFPYIVPVAYVANGLWLYRALCSCGILEQENGAWLPTKFRAVLYLDVFGWLVRNKKVEQQAKEKTPAAKLPHQPTQLPDGAVRTPAAGVGGSGYGGARPEPEGPSGQIDAPPDEAFQPHSFVPPEAQTAIEADVSIVTGHDKLQPGKLAASVFRAGTWMLIALWSFGLFVSLPVSIFHEALVQPLVADVYLQELDPTEHPGQGGMHARLGMDASGLPELVPTVEEDPDGLPMLPGKPEHIKVAWPSHASFIPHAFAVTSSGTKFLVSDDFNVYVGDLLGAGEDIVAGPAPVVTVPSPVAAAGGGGDGTGARVAAGPAWPTLSPPSDWPPMATPGAAGGGGGSQQLAEGTQLAAAAAPRSLRGAQLGAAQHKLELAFSAGATCPALIGQALKDISVVCPPRDGARGDGRDCRLIVLTKRGTHVVECSLPEPRASGESGWESSPGASASSSAWEVSQDWLHQSQEETAQSFVANPVCLHESRFEPSETGCAVVGTSIGRIVQMRESISDTSRLVPERIIHQRSHPSSRGASAIVHGRFLLTLWAKTGTISAFNTFDGSLVKEWRLPGHVKWLMVTAGGDHLFLIGVGGGQHVELYRFRLPEELDVARPALPGALPNAVEA